MSSRKPFTVCIWSTANEPLLNGVRTSSFEGFYRIVNRQRPTIAPQQLVLVTVEYQGSKDACDLNMGAYWATGLSGVLETVHDAFSQLPTTPQDEQTRRRNWEQFDTLRRLHEELASV